MPIERVVFFGTPDFAVPTLAALVAAGRAPLAVVTQPSRPVGRGHKLEDPPVARFARAQGLPVLQPEKVRRPEFIEEMRRLAPDVAVVVAFGQIFPRDLLAIPTYGCLNLHASLLPRHRGAAPIQAAVAAGEAVTGVSVMQMEEGLDSGPVLAMAEVPIGPRETAGELAPRLAERGAALVVETLAGLEAGTVTPRRQDDALATYAPRLTREAGRADWSLTAAELASRLRAYTPWPGLSAELGGAPVKLVRAYALAELAEEEAGEAPGTFLGVRAGHAAVACGEGSVLAIEVLQRPGKKAVPAPDFVNGERLLPGQRFS
jgi:methionyl-tRNA formyltransferase